MNVQNLIYDKLLSKCDASHSTVFTGDDFGKRMQKLFTKCMSSENRTAIMDDVVENSMTPRRNSVLVNAGISSTNDLKDCVDLFYLMKYFPSYRKAH